MSRTIHADVITASQSAHVVAVAAVDLDFSSGHVRLNSSPYELTIDSNAYTGAGNLGAISLVEEGSELKSYGMTMKLSGISTSLISIALSEHYQGRDATVYIALLNTTTHAIVGTPLLVWKGRMDTMDITAGQTAEFTLSCESRLVDWERPRIRRYTHEDQQLYYPGDTFFEFVPQMQDFQLVWGRA